MKIKKNNSNSQLNQSLKMRKSTKRMWKSEIGKVIIKLVAIICAGARWYT